MTTMQALTNYVERHKRTTPEMKFALEMLMTAVHDLVVTKGATLPKARRLREQTLGWIKSGVDDDDPLVTTFPMCCSLLGLESDVVREWILLNFSDERPTGRKVRTRRTT